MKRIIILTWLFAALAQQAFGQSGQFYCDNRDLGENFYCEPPEPVEEEKTEIMGPSLPPQSPVPEFEEFKKKLEDARDKAVWTGDPKDIEEYMVLQKQAGEMSSRFMTEYQFIGWQNPNLSYIAGRPVNTVGKRAYRGQRRAEVERQIKKLNNRYGLYYFYSKDCGACITFSPILKMFSSRHQIVVMPVAKPGKESVEWPGTKPDNGISERLGLYGDVTPAVILFDSKEKVGVPISYGVVSMEDLENRIYMLTREDSVKFLGGDDDVR